jgi:hypothetical protein
MTARVAGLIQAARYDPDDRVKSSRCVTKIRALPHPGEGAQALGSPPHGEELRAPPPVRFA